MTIINQKSISGITSITFASAGDDLLTFHSNNGTERFRIDNSGNTKITAGIVTTLTVTGTTTLNGNLDLQDNDKILIGTGDDLEIYHDGSHSYIDDSGTGSLKILSNQFEVKNAADSEMMIRADQDGEVNLYHNGSGKLNTKSDGVDITGELQCDTLDVDGNIDLDSKITFDSGGNVLDFIDNVAARFGTGNDLQVYHDGSNSRIKNTTGSLWLQSDTGIRFTDAGVNESMAAFYDNGAVELYYDGSKKFETSSGGAVLQGKLQAEANSASAQLELKRTNSNVTGAIGALNFTALDGHSVANIHALGDGDNEGAHLVFKTTTAAAENNPYGSGTIERMRILSTGGLTFNGDTATANALDDYEEGTFTATCDNSVTLHSDTNLLQYVKIGSSVTVMGQIRVNSSNSGSSLTINNLPFTVYSSGEGSAYAVGAVRLYSADMASDHKYVVAIADGGSTNLTFQGVRDNATSQGLGASDNGYYMFSVTYRTST